MHLTDLETKVVAQFGKFLNYDSLEDNIADNATYFTADEIEGMRPRVRDGVLGSLVKKGLIAKDGCGNFLVTEDGLRVYYNLAQ